MYNYKLSMNAHSNSLYSMKNMLLNVESIKKDIFA